MKRSIAVRWCLGLVLGLIAAPLTAQTTGQGAVILQGSPKPGLADRARRTMGAEVVVVDRIRGRHGWWKRSGYRVITVYSDGTRFYRRPFGRTILHKVVVYERGGRYYINDHQWKRHRYGEDRDHHDNGNHYGWDNH